MPLDVGRAFRCEVGTALSSALNVTGISRASAAAVSGTGFTVAAGDFVYMGQVDGMVELSFVVARVAASPAPTATAFTLEGIDSTNFGTWIASPGVQRITTWSTLAQVTSVDFGAGQVDSLDATTLLDVSRQNLAGLLALPDVTVNLFTDYSVTVQGLIDTAAYAGTILPFRFTKQSGNRRCLAGMVSTVGENVQVNQVIGGSFTIIRRSNRDVKYLT